MLVHVVATGYPESSGAPSQLPEPWAGPSTAVNDWAKTVQRTSDGFNARTLDVSSAPKWTYPPVFDKNPAPDLLSLHPNNGFPSGNGLPLLHLTNLLNQQQRKRRSRRKPNRDDAPVEGSDALDAQLEVGNDWYSQMSVQGMRGQSLKRYAKQMGAAGQNEFIRPDAPYLQAGQGWAPSDYEYGGILDHAQGQEAAQKNWRSLERDANTAEMMAAGMNAPMQQLERAATPPAPEVPLAQSPKQEKEAATLGRVVSWRQRMRDPAHMAWIREHAAEHPLDLSQQRAMAQSGVAAPPGASGGGGEGGGGAQPQQPPRHANGSPPDPWEMEKALETRPLDLVADEPPLVRLQREKFAVPSARGEYIDTVMDHQQL